MNTHRFTLEVKTAGDAKAAELAVLAAFAKRQPDGCEFQLTEPTRPRWMKVAAAAEYMSMGRSTIYELIKAGKIKSHMVLTCRLIDRESLDAFVASKPEES